MVVRFVKYVHKFIAVGSTYSQMLYLNDIICKLSITGNYMKLHIAYSSQKISFLINSNTYFKKIL